MENLRLFNSEEEYNLAKDTFVYPNVSYVTESEMIHYMKASNYEFVDLGLPSGLKWATCNIGAKEPHEGGLYFAWGETKGYLYEDGIILNSDGTETEKQFNDDYSDYELYDFSSSSFKKYNDIDGITTLELEDDACYFTDKGMRIPTKEEWQELIDNSDISCEYDYDSEGAVYRNVRYIFTSKINQKTLIFPDKEGLSNGNIMMGPPYVAFIPLWTSTRTSNEEAFYLLISSDLTNTYSQIETQIRCCGFQLRAVQE